MSTNTMDRRTFLRWTGRVSAGALGAFLLPGCGGVSQTGQAASNNQNYYLANKSKIKKEVDELCGYVRKVSAGRYGDDLAGTLVKETIQGFDGLLPDLPYIGGFANDLTANLYQSAAGLAFYRTMLAHGKTLEETGEILFRATELQFSSIPLGGMVARMATSKPAKDKNRAEAAGSQKRQYPGDWVFDFIDGDGKEFDYGIDYTECGICKYYQAQGAAEMIPYMCLLDYPVSAALNSGLVRTTTLGRGGARCDFRYRIGRPVQLDWTPDFLKKE